ncbi:MAG TPA: response regulator [Candidatus Nitrosopolaris sp.]|nr:response regulator [Candidatus Nitrosopolaris sp.]
MQILVAEDDNDTGLIYKNLLEDRRGHHVIITSSGESCLKIYHQKLRNVEWEALHIQPFDAVILDYKMPGMDGMEVATEILAINPQQRIIFASAYIKETLLDSVKLLKQPVELLQKPFGEEDLIYSIEKKEIYSELQRLVHSQIVDLLDVFRKLGQRQSLGEELENVEIRHEEIRNLLDLLDKQKRANTYKKW